MPSRSKASGESSFAVIIPAAGRSLRFGGERNKLLTMLGGKPVIAHAAGAFLCRADVATVVIATNDPSALMEAVGHRDGRIQYCAGGATRAESVRQGLMALDPGIEWVAVHDGARPLVSQALIDRTVGAAREHGAAVPATAVTLTIKQATGPLPAPVQRTIPRKTLWAMQTPQIMRRAWLERAFAHCPMPLESVTDDAQLLELAGETVWLVEGEERNLKLTTTADLELAQAYLASGRQGQGI